MKKKDLVERLSYKFCELEKEDLEFIVTSFFETLKEELKKGNRIEFRDFGVLLVKKSRGIIFKNPRNNQRYYVKEKFRVLFKVGKEFKERLNTPFLGSLDLGTQSFRLCLGKCNQGEVRYLVKDRINVRLGEGFGDKGIISKEAMKRGLEALRSFKELLDRFDVQRYRAVGTAIFRMAKNAEEFLKKAEEIGIKIDVISPEEEAELDLLGIMAGLEEAGLNCNKFLCVDVGGGSTEFIAIKEGKKEWVKSVNIGAVVLKELFDFRYPVNSKVVNSVREYIRDKLREIPCEEFEEIIITGGSASLLGSLDLKLTKYVPEKLHSHRVYRDRIEKLVKRLSSYDLERIQKIKGMEKGREDIALPGLLVYSCLIDYFKKDSLVISEYGILEGTLLSLIKDYNLVKP